MNGLGMSIAMKSLQQGREEGRAEMAEKMRKNLRGSALTEEQIAEIIRKSIEEAEADARNAS